jgi:hypothetical protein
MNENISWGLKYSRISLKLNGWKTKQNIVWKREIAWVRESSYSINCWWYVKRKRRSRKTEGKESCWVLKLKWWSTKIKTSLIRLCKIIKIDGQRRIFPLHSWRLNRRVKIDYE